MSDDPRVDAALSELEQSCLATVAWDEDEVREIVRQQIAAADKAAWRPISEARSQEDVLATALLNGEWARPVLLYHEPYEDLGWLCAITHRPVAHEPTHFRYVTVPQSGD